MDDYTSLESEELKPWEQQPGEPAVWFARFTEWLHQELPRSVSAVYHADRRRAGKQVKTRFVANNWSVALIKYCWRARGAAWDAAEQERKDREWIVAREAERQKELAIAVKLRAKAEELLKLPTLVQEIKHDRNGVEIAWLLIPEFRAFQAAYGMLGEAKKHARAALEMPDKFERSDVTSRVGGAIEVEAYVQLTPEERLGRLLDITRQITATPRS